MDKPFFSTPDKYHTVYLPEFNYHLKFTSIITVGLSHKISSDNTYFKVPWTLP